MASELTLPASDAIQIANGAQPQPLVAVSGVSKAFGERTAIEDVSFQVHPREFVALLGPSGSGKTTLFKCMTGLMLPDRGSVRVAGLDVRTLHGRARRHVAVVFQQFNLVGRLSALDNVLAGRLGYVPSWRGWTRRFTRKDRLLGLECLDRVGLVTHASQRADTLSGGQQQRVAIARAIAQQPDVIVADEPIASLDPNISAGILELLHGICREGVSVVCSLHQVHFARQYADRIVGLAAGRVAVDTPVKAFDERAAARLYGATDASWISP
jgi:phosphonate transport system ATP-binding protein